MSVGSSRRQARSDPSERQAKLDALHERLVDEVRKIRTGDDWRAWLDTASRFHQYSFRNVLLIAAQRPDATTVAGYTTWKKLGRQVNKGERGIAILAPVLSRRQTPTARAAQPTRHSEHAEHAARPDHTHHTNSPSDSVEQTHQSDQPDKSDGSGRSASSTSLAGRSGGRLVGVRPAYVWDISQTSGEPLPSPPTPAELTGDAPAGLWGALAARVTAAGFTLHREAIAAGGEYGYTDYRGRRVVVAERLGPADAAATLAHEVAHMVMHDPADFPLLTTRLCRGVREVEAESVAYLITAHHGLATDTASFPYVATWATKASTTDTTGTAGRDEPERIVQETGQRVMTTARELIEAMTNQPLDHTPRTPTTGLDLAATADLAVRRSDDVRRHGLPTPTSKIRPPLFGTDPSADPPTVELTADW